MLDDTKYRSPYYGLWIVLLVMIGGSVLLYAFFYEILELSPIGPRYLNEPSARALGFGVSTVFQLSCYVAGVFKQHVAAVGRRVFSFFGNLKVSLGFAFKCYFEDVRSDGAVLLIVLAVTALCAYVSYTGLRDFLALWGH